jgi:DNA topoisomerase-1
MEDNLDLIAAGEKTWQPVIREFYDAFHNNLTNKYEEIKKSDIMPEEKSNEVCDKCGAAMIVKTGRYGKFLACSAFPDCRNIQKVAGGNGEYTKKESDPQTLELEKKYAGEICDKCGSAMKVKTGKFGPFLACSAYPKCKNIKNINTGNGKEVTCPACKEGKIVKKFSRRGAFYACSAYPKCKNAYWGEPTGENCPHCKSLMITDKSGEVKCSNKECAYVK